MSETIVTIRGKLPVANWAEINTVAPTPPAVKGDPQKFKAARKRANAALKLLRGAMQDMTEASGIGSFERSETYRGHRDLDAVEERLRRM